MAKEVKDMGKKELQILAKQLSIKGLWNMNKEQLINSINEKLVCVSGIKESKVDNVKLSYINRVDVGTLIAFNNVIGKDINGDEIVRCLTGAIIKKDEENQILFVESKRGNKFNVPYHKVLWLKTGTRWPSDIYKLLKNKK